MSDSPLSTGGSRSPRISSRSSRGCWTRRRPKRRTDGLARRAAAHHIQPRVPVEEPMEHSFGPYLEIARIQSEMNKLFDVLLEMRDEVGGEANVHAWIPSVDVCQNGEGLVVRCELPGVPASSLKVTALGGALI